MGAIGIGISAWRLVSGRLVRSSSGWKECVLGYGRHLEMMGGDGETPNRACCLCILHRAIVYNDECPTASWILSRHVLPMTSRASVSTIP